MIDTGYKTIVENFKAKMAERIVGQQELIEGILTAYIAGGHVLLEGVPGLAKTLIVKTFAELSNVSFKRIQFTPDLLPADLIGTLIYQKSIGKFSVRRGPVFANIVLADEINRAPAKVQSALLEAMAEGQVTIGENSFSLPAPFFVLATQNPIEQEGTYPLPEAELDRFLLKLFVPYPSIEEEINIVNKFSSLRPSQNLGQSSNIGPAEAVLTPENLETLRNAVEQVKCSPEITSYIVSIIAATRPAKNVKQDDYIHGNYLSYILYGASPRAGIAIQKCAKIKALFNGRDYVIPEDAADNLTADDIIEKLLGIVPQP